ncbi:hypothetical protein [Croceitalea rosinachiae]|uniref:YD repeat-containing protein n=1 Tax=Croceitalea rosinachiae TaxID=3075596 RepID=A0ABU3AE50_9FLAO|nr:hypothetical protein [Croceitalea sp. F388]MDT0608469.1 hypothetical protein [Croceitalea sp. F388]
MKRLSLFILSICCFNCSIDDSENDIKDLLRIQLGLVDYMTDYDGDTTWIYQYDNHKRLTKITYSDLENKNEIQFLFKYENNFLIEIERDYITFPEFSYKIKYNYEDDKIKRVTILKSDNIISTRNLNYNDIDKVISINRNDEKPYVRFIYDDQNKNVVEAIFLLVDSWTGEEYEQVHHFEYDDRKKPNFGLPFTPGFRPEVWGESTKWEVSLSENNMILDKHGKRSFQIEYLNDLIPKAITYIPQEYTTVDPIIQNIIYK